MSENEWRDDLKVLRQFADAWTSGPTRIKTPPPAVDAARRLVGFLGRNIGRPAIITHHHGRDIAVVDAVLNGFFETMGFARTETLTEWRNAAVLGRFVTKIGGKPATVINLDALDAYIS